jgi:hypothetical protein
MQDHESEVILAACGYTVEKLFLVSSILSEKIECLFRLNKTIVNECMTCINICRYHKRNYPEKEELIDRAFFAMGAEDYSTLHKCNKPEGFPFLITFTQRISLSNIYDPEDPGYVQPLSVCSSLTLDQIMETYVGEATMSSKMGKKKQYKAPEKEPLQKFTENKYLDKYNNKDPRKHFKYS